jgi:hypothetical protein
LDDYPQQEDFPMMDHYCVRAYFPKYNQQTKIIPPTHSPSKGILLHLSPTNMHLGRICLTNVQHLNYGKRLWVDLEDTRSKISWIHRLHHLLWVNHLQQWMQLWIVRALNRLYWNLYPIVLMSTKGDIKQLLPKTMVSHKPTFVITRRDPISNMIKNRVKDNIIKTWQWTKKLQDV